jgi:succinyl-diaminopimelate desuccinylase
VNDAANALTGGLNPDLNRLVELTSALVEVDTRNPPGNERRIAAVCREALRRWEPAWTEVEPADGRLSLIARLPHPDGPGPRPTLIINGHLDVVPVKADAWTVDPFRPAVINGRLYGRGTADMKGGIAAAICALEMIELAGRAPAWNVVFHLVADEERGGALGSATLLADGLISGDACLVPEPTSLGICLAERGLLHAEVTVHGRPGHGSRPREGISAVEQAARLVLALHAVDFGEPEHRLLGRPTANIGTIHGGSGINTVAESCTIGVDRRLLPGVSEPAALADLKARIEAVGIEGLRYDIEVLSFGEASEQDPSDPFVARVRGAVAAATGTDPPLIGMTFTTDARFMRNQAGIPTVVCGPGNVEQAHGNDEWVSVNQLGQAATAFATLMLLD